MSGKQSSGDMLKAYALFSQGIIGMIVLGGIGFIIGWKVDKHSALCGILAVVGGLMGLAYFILLIYKNHYFDSKPVDNKEKEDNHEE